MNSHFTVSYDFLTLTEEPDAGWNDPPKFSYCESMQYTNSPKRNTLNKRVAFPMNSTPSVTATPSNIDPTTTPVFNTNLPPPPTSSVPLACEKDDNSSESNDPKTESVSSTIQSSDSSPPNDEVPELSYILESLSAVMDEKRETLNSTVSITYMAQFRIDSEVHGPRFCSAE